MSFKLQRIESLFPSPLVVSELAGHQALNVALLAEIAKRRASEPSQDRSNRQGWHSAADLFSRKEKAHRELAQSLLAMTMAATQKLFPDVDVAKLSPTYGGWINVNPEGGYNAPHDHPGFLWSGVYYVCVPEPGPDNQDGGAIEFLDARASTTYTRMFPGPMTSDKVKVWPKAGNALLFPSQLRHWVHPNSAGVDRVTVAFNVGFRRITEGAGRPRS